MKWLKDDSYNAMKQAADNWDKLLNKVLGDNPDMKAEDSGSAARFDREHR